MRLLLEITGESQQPSRKLRFFQWLLGGDHAVQNATWIGAQHPKWSFLNHAALSHHINLIGLRNGRKSVSNDQDCRVICHLLD